MLYQFIIWIQININNNKPTTKCMNKPLCIFVIVPQNSSSSSSSKTREHMMFPRPVADWTTQLISNKIVSYFLQVTQPTFCDLPFPFFTYFKGQYNFVQVTAMCQTIYQTVVSQFNTAINTKMSQSFETSNSRQLGNLIVFSKIINASQMFISQLIKVLKCKASELIQVCKIVNKIKIQRMRISTEVQIC